MKHPNTNTDPYQDLHDGMHKFTLCIDFDGVLHQYSQGWKGPVEIYDPPVPGAISWLQKIIADERFDPCIYSSRSKDPKAIKAMKDWLFKHGLTPAELKHLSFPCEKPAAWLTIDDRCFLFRGQFPTLDFMAGFAGWTKRVELVRQANGEDATDADFIRQLGLALHRATGDGKLLDRTYRIAAELEGKVHE